MNIKILAALQLGSDPTGTAATVEKILAFENDIKTSGCDLVLMPEALLGGYPKGADFGTRVGYRTAEGREDFLDTRANTLVANSAHRLGLEYHRFADTTVNQDIQRLIQTHMLEILGFRYCFDRIEPIPIEKII